MNNKNNENKQNIEQEQNNNKKIVGLKPNLRAEDYMRVHDLRGQFVDIYNLTDKFEIGNVGII